MMTGTGQRSGTMFCLRDSADNGEKEKRKENNAATQKTGPADNTRMRDFL